MFDWHIFNHFANDVSLSKAYLHTIFANDGFCGSGVRDLLLIHVIAFFRSLKY